MLNLGYPYKTFDMMKVYIASELQELDIDYTVHIPIVLAPEYHFSLCAYIAAFKCDSLTQTLLSKMCSCRSIRPNSDVLSKPNVKTCMTKENWKHGHLNEL